MDDHWLIFINLLLLLLLLIFFFLLLPQCLLLPFLCLLLYISYKLSFIFLLPLPLLLLLLLLLHYLLNIPLILYRDIHRFSFRYFLLQFDLWWFYICIYWGYWFFRLWLLCFNFLIDFFCWCLNCVWNLLGLWWEMRVIGVYLGCFFIVLGILGYSSIFHFYLFTQLIYCFSFFPLFITTLTYQLFPVIFPQNLLSILTSILLSNITSTINMIIFTISIRKFFQLTKWYLTFYWFLFLIYIYIYIYIFMYLLLLYWLFIFDFICLRMLLWLSRDNLWDFLGWVLLLWRVLDIVGDFGLC